MIERIDVWTAGTIGPTNPGGMIGWGLVICRNGKEVHSSNGTREAAANNTNVLAEYVAVCGALAWILTNDLAHHQNRFFTGNFIVARQMNGHWKVKEKGSPVGKIAEVARLMAMDFRDLSFTWTDRDDRRADYLSKILLKQAGIPVYEDPRMIKEEVHREKRKTIGNSGNA